MNSWPWLFTSGRQYTAVAVIENRGCNHPMQVVQTAVGMAMHAGPVSLWHAAVGQAVAAIGMGTACVVFLGRPVHIVFGVSMLLFQLNSGMCIRLFIAEGWNPWNGDTNVDTYVLRSNRKKLPREALTVCTTRPVSYALLSCLVGKLRHEPCFSCCLWVSQKLVKPLFPLIGTSQCLMCSSVKSSANQIELHNFFFFFAELTTA